MTSRKVLVTGASGMLATEIVTYLRNLEGYDVVGLTHAELDIAYGGDADGILEQHNPDVVINTAAVHVDDCEADPSKAYLVNTWGARNLAMACDLFEATFVHISTGGLFGDDVREYHEYDPIVLKTVYARSKWMGEEEARRWCERHFVLRLGWLYGGGVEHKKNFVVARYREAIQKSVLQSAADKYGSPTSAKDVARWLPMLLDSEEYGTYHLANGGGCSRAEYVDHIVRAFDLPTRVEPVDSTHFPRKANVPDCEMLASLNLGYAGIPALPGWKDALSEYISSIKRSVELL